MSAVEVQFSAATFQSIIQRLVAATRDCEAPKPCSEGSTELCYLDHMSFGASTGIDTAKTGDAITLPGGHVVNARGAPIVKVPVTAHYKTATCARDPDCPANQFVNEESGTAFIKMSVEKDAQNQDVLCGDLVALGCAVCAPAQPIKVCQALGLDLAGLQAGAPTLVGIVVTSDAPQRVALRFDFSHVSTGPNGEPTIFTQAFASKSQSFFDGEVFKPAPSAGASLSIGQKLLRRSIKNKIVDSLAKPAACATCTNNCPESCGILHSPSSVSTSWLPGGSTGHVHAETSFVYQNDVCDFEIDLGVDVTLSFEPAAGPGDVSKLVSHIELEYSSSFWDFVKCAPGAGGVGGLITAGIVKAITEGVANNKSFAMGEDCVQHTETSYTCKTPAGLPPIDIWHPGPVLERLEFPLTQMIANSGGLHLFGAPLMPQPFEPTYGVGVHDPTLDVHGNCNDAYAGYMGRICRGGLAKVCSVQYQLRAGQKDWAIDPVWGPKPNGCTNVIPLFSPADPDDPFSPPTQPPKNDFTFMVHTTAGVRSYRMHAPPPLTLQQLNDLEFAVMNKQLMCSLKLAPSTGIIYDPRWDIDPPPYLDPLRNRFASVIGPQKLVTYGIAAISNLQFELRDDGLWLLGDATFGNRLDDPRAIQSASWQHLVLRAEQVTERDLSAVVEMVLEDGLDIEVPMPAGIDTWTWDAVMSLQLGYRYDSALLEAHGRR